MNVIEPEQKELTLPIVSKLTKYGLLSFCIENEKVTGKTVETSYKTLQMDEWPNWLEQSMYSVTFRPQFRILANSDWRLQQEEGEFTVASLTLNILQVQFGLNLRP